MVFYVNNWSNFVSFIYESDITHVHHDLNGFHLQIITFAFSKNNTTPKYFPPYLVKWTQFEETLHRFTTKISFIQSHQSKPEPLQNRHYKGRQAGMHPKPCNFLLLGKIDTYSKHSIRGCHLTMPYSLLVSISWKKGKITSNQSSINELLSFL